MKKLMIAAALAALSAHTQAADFSLRVIGATSLPTGTLFEGVEFGGISGIDRAADGSYWAISDDRGGERGTPRFYNLALDYDAAGFNGVTIKRQINMQRPDGTPFPANARTVDPESIRVAPNGNLYWSSEGNWSANAAARYQPFVREMTTEGVFVREFSTPSMYDYVDNGTTGGRSNKLFEALTVAPDGTVFVANEDALVQDGNITTLDAGSVVRVTALDPVTGSARGQYAYELPPIPVTPPPARPSVRTTACPNCWRFPTRSSSPSSGHSRPASATPSASRWRKSPPTPPTCRASPAWRTAATRRCAASCCWKCPSSTRASRWTTSKA